MSYGNQFKIQKELWNYLSHKKYKRECEAAWMVHRALFVVLYQQYGILEDYMIYTLFTFTLRGHQLQWCVTLPDKPIHSLHQFIGEVDDSFHHFDYKEMNKEILKLRKAPNESVE